MAARDPERPLSDRQERFVNEYLIDLNVTQAAIRAGYNPRTAAGQGSRLLKNAKVQAEIRKKRERLQYQCNITQEMVINELAAIAFSNGADYASVTREGLVSFVPTKSLSKDKLAAIAGIKMTAGGGAEVKLNDKLRALEMLGKYLGLFDGQQAAEQPENNLLEALTGTNKGVYDEIPELQRPADADDDLVE